MSDKSQLQPEKKKKKKKARTHTHKKKQLVTKAEPISDISYASVRAD